MDPETAALHFELHLALTLEAEGLLPVWQADLRSPGEQGLHFESMPALIRYLAHLETNGLPTGGIR